MARRLSSRTTFIYKRVFPVFWFGFLIFFTVTALFVISKSPAPGFVIAPMLIVPVIMAIFSYFIMKYFVFDLADDVIDEGDVLVVTKGGETDRIALKNIINVNHTIMTNPPRITLQLRTPSRFGDKVTFSPPGRVWPFSPHPIAEELVRRVDASRKSG